MTDDWRPRASHATLRRRARLLADLRAFMEARDVLEVATPLVSRAAPAERALDTFAVEGGGYLVPSPEHGLKRLLAAGADAIYQLGPVFRAGEAGRWHNPEFCMLEWYRPRAGMADLIDETQALLETVGDRPCQPSCSYRAVFEAATGLDPLTASAATLARWAHARGIAPPDAATHDRVFWLDLIMSLEVQPTLGHDGPVCITGFPADDAVLVELDPADDRIAQRFEVFWRGVELANGAQELTRAACAEQRMQRERAARRVDDGRAPPIDHRLLDAMHAGLPRCAGVALGVDRLLALILGFDGITETLAFDWSRR